MGVFKRLEEERVCENCEHYVLNDLDESSCEFYEDDDLKASECDDYSET